MTYADFYSPGGSPGTFGPGGPNDPNVGADATENAMNAGPFNRSDPALDRRGTLEKLSDRVVGALRSPSGMMKALAVLAPSPVPVLVALGAKMGSTQKDMMAKDAFGKSFDELSMSQKADVQEAYNAYQAAAHQNDNTVEESQEELYSGAPLGSSTASAGPNAFGLNLITPSRPGALRRRPTLPSINASAGASAPSAFSAPRIII